MSLNGISIATGATISVTGGTAFVLASDGKAIANGIHLIESAASSYYLMKSATFSVRRAAAQKDGTYSKRIGSCSLVIPSTLTDGKVTYSVVRCSVEAHPELSAAEVLDLRYIGAQVLVSATATPFFTNQAIV